MGITLVPVNESMKDFEYNWSGWKFLMKCLDAWGVDTNDFSDHNDGSLLSAETCRVVAGAIESNLDNLSTKDKQWLSGHIDGWRLSGGFEQW